MFYQNDDFYNDIYSKKLKKLHTKDYLYLEKPEDPKRLYRENSYGFRSDQFNENTDFLSLGCSVTYGYGIAENFIWSNLLSSTLDKSNSILAAPGVSVEWLVDQTFKYFHSVGHPPMILALFPDLLRINIPVDGNFYRKKNYVREGIKEEKGHFSHVHVDSPKAKINKSLIKFPYEYEKAISPYLSIHTAIKSIKYLEQYCKATNIKFLWSTWSNNFLKTMNKLEDLEDLKFDNYFDFKKYGGVDSAKLFKTYRKNIFFDSIEEMELCDNSHRFVECSCYKTCHSEFAESMGQEFDYGTDNKNRLSASHPGGHYHLHIAEAFEKKVKELGWV